MKENLDQFDKIELSAQNRELRSEIEDLKTCVNGLRDDNKGIVENTTQLVDIFKTMLKPEHPGVVEEITLKPPDTGDVSYS